MSAQQARQAIEATMEVADGTDQYLTFILDGEDYGVDILRVQEIKGWDTATPMPNMPDYILGIINLRGTVVPVVDARKFFKLKSAPFNETTVVIVVKVQGDDHIERTMGLVVDEVSEVHNIPASSLKSSPEFGGAVNNAAFRGLATVNDKMVIIIDIDHLMQDGVLQALDRDVPNS